MAYLYGPIHLMGCRKRKDKTRGRQIIKGKKSSGPDEETIFFALDKNQLYIITLNNLLPELTRLPC